MLLMTASPVSAQQLQPTQIVQPVERVTRHFQEELGQLKTRLLEMGGLAEEQVRVAIKALVDRDQALIQTVLAHEEEMDLLCIEIDDRPRFAWRGSHVVMQKRTSDSTITVPVPDHKEIRIGTLQSIIRQSQLPRELFEVRP